MFTRSIARTKISRFCDEETLNTGETIMIFTEYYTKRGGTQQNLKSGRIKLIRMQTFRICFITLLQPGIINRLISEAVSLKLQVSWEVMPFRWINSYRRFNVQYSLKNVTKYPKRQRHTPEDLNLQIKFL